MNEIIRRFAGGFPESVADPSDLARDHSSIRHNRQSGAWREGSVLLRETA